MRETGKHRLGIQPRRQTLEARPPALAGLGPENALRRGVGEAEHLFQVRARDHLGHVLSNREHKEVAGVVQLRVRLLARQALAEVRHRVREGAGQDGDHGVAQDADE